MQGDPQEDKIEELKKTLYSRQGVSRDVHVLDLNKHGEESVSNKWTAPIPSDFGKPVDITPVKKGSLLNKILIFAVIFFVFSISFAAYMIFSGRNIVSPDKIEINVIGPASVQAGDEASFEVDITNKNGTPLELADLLVEYPKGTRSAVDKITDLPRETIPIANIGAGETVRKTIKIIPFGEEGDNLDMKMSFEYQIANSTSHFNKDLTHTFAIGSSPISLTVDTLDEINSNQDLDITVTVVSNSKETLKNLLLTSDIPFGFQLKSATPQPLTNKLAWRLGDLESLGKRIIKIKGTVLGEANQNRVFKFGVGTEDSKSQGTLSSYIAVADHEINIMKPFLAADILFNNTSPDTFLARSGEQINMAVNYENNLPTLLSDVEIQARLSGAMLDQRKVTADGGFYKSSDNSINWTKFDKPELASVSSGKGGTLTAHLSIFGSDSSEIENLKNQAIKIDLTIKGKRLSEKGVPEEITSVVSKVVKVLSDIKLTGRIAHSVGPIENKGDIPPTVNKETQYTVVWGITNNFNNVENAKVTAVLPIYVDWTGVASPANEKITFNKDSREVTWDLGKVVAGTTAPREAAFQISLTPDLSQVGFAPELLQESTLTGTDSFANSPVRVSIGAMNTTLSGDPQFQYGYDRVRE